MKHKKTTNKVTQCEDGTPDCFYSPEPVEKAAIRPPLNGKLKEGYVLVDDMGESYLVLEVFKNSVVVSPLENWQNLSCEIMSYTAMNNEGWVAIKQLKVPKES